MLNSSIFFELYYLDGAEGQKMIKKMKRVHFFLDFCPFYFYILVLDMNKAEKLALAAALIFTAGCGQHDFSSIFGQQNEDELNDSSSSMNSISNNASSSSRSISSSSISCNSGPEPIPENWELMTNNEEEMKLYELIMQYREEKGLPRIPISKSLTAVAKVHTRDLHENGSTFRYPCNSHTWSDKGNWAGCCYSSLRPDGKCMWNKPSEITSYASYGYEIAVSSLTGNTITAENALTSWKGSYDHNDVIINLGIWEDVQWKAIGMGIYKEFAVVWFGEKSDECKDNCITLENGGLVPRETPPEECKGEVEYKWCVGVNVYGSGIIACREIGEKLTLEQCTEELSKHGFFPAEKPPVNCAEV
jgi:hypothetical protein